MCTVCSLVRAIRLWFVSTQMSIECMPFGKCRKAVVYILLHGCAVSVVKIGKCRMTIGPGYLLLDGCVVSAHW